VSGHFVRRVCDIREEGQVKITAVTAAVLVLSPLAPLAGAQDSFPTRTVTIVNPNAPGGTSDIIGRGMMESLQRSLKQPVIMINRVGAGGAVGGTFVAKAPADGYHTLLNTVTHVLIPITEKVLGRSAPYSPDDFVLLARITSDPLLFIVHPSLPVKSVKELVALARAKPGELTFSSPGLYSTGHVSVAMLARAAKISVLHAPFNGAGPAMTAVLGGHVFMMHVPVGVGSPHVSVGRVRLIAQTGPERGPAFPDTPTLKEAGYDAHFMLWAGYFAHVNTPPAVAKTWQAALRAGAEDPKFKATMAKINVTIDYLDGDALKAWYDAELKRLESEMRAIGKLEG
jgi:tripartite-type tricarboxylate transporter receptor subunit TctC